MHARRLLVGLASAWLYVAPSLALAAPASGWFVSLGAFNPKASTNIRLDVPGVSLGTNLHLEHDLNLPQRRVVPQAALGYRFNDRSSLEFDYYDLRRTGSRVIDENITYQGVHYALNTTVSTFSDIRTQALVYRYQLVDRDPWELSVAAGLHATHFSIGLSDLTSGVSASADAQAPLPLVGLRGAYDLDGWRLQAEAVYFQMTINRIRGHLNHYTLSLSHALIGGLSLEFGYTYYVLRLAAHREYLTGNMRFAYQGPFLNLCYGCQPRVADARN